MDNDLRRVGFQALEKVFVYSLEGRVWEKYNKNMRLLYICLDMLFMGGGFFLEGGFVCLVSVLFFS